MAGGASKNVYGSEEVHEEGTVGTMAFSHAGHFSFGEFCRLETAGNGSRKDKTLCRGARERV